jgi:sulfate transport system ATP-binding protein
MAIDARHVSKSFAQYTALRDVNLKVNDGELVALLGPSGSGKTTLLRIIAGLDTPDPNPQTAVFVNDEEVSGKQVSERKVGFVFQHYALFRHMTVYENIAFGLRVRPRKVRPSNDAIRAKVNELLELIQLGRWAAHYPSQLSGGQRQRVALARALAIEPSILLLDEPFGALDARVRQDLRRWLRNLHAKIHITSVLVTHDQEEALEVADRVVIMNQGRIEQIGTPNEVFHQPASEFVVTFLGNVNLFHGRMEAGQAVIGKVSVGRRQEVSVPDGKTARVFVRPHELEIERQPLNGADVRSKVARIQSAGSIVRVELTSEQNEAITVELTHDRYGELAIQVGDEVFVRVRDARVFVAEAPAVDFSI